MIASTITGVVPILIIPFDSQGRIDVEGYVHLSQKPGMGYEIEWDYINDNLIDPTTFIRKTI